MKNTKDKKGKKIILEKGDAFKKNARHGASHALQKRHKSYFVTAEIRYAISHHDTPHDVAFFFNHYLYLNYFERKWFYITNTCT